MHRLLKDAALRLCYLLARWPSTPKVYEASGYRTLVHTAIPTVSSPYIFESTSPTDLSLNSYYPNPLSPSNRTICNARRLHWSLSRCWIPHSRPASFFPFNSTMDCYPPRAKAGSFVFRSQSCRVHQFRQVTID